MYFIGLHRENHFLHVALLQGDKKNPSIKLLRSFVIKDNEEDVKPLYNLFLELDKKNIHICSSLSLDDVLYRKIELKLTKSSVIKKMIPFQFEENHPYSYKDAIVLPFLEKNNKTGQSTISFFSARKQNVQDHLDSWQMLGIEPEFITSSTRALTCFSQHFFPRESSLFIFHLGSEKSSWILMQEGRLTHSLCVDFGSSKFLSAVKTDFPSKSQGEILHLLQTKKDLLFLESPQFAETAKVFSQLQKQFLRMYLFCQQNAESELPQKIVITGEMVSFHCIDQFYRRCFPDFSFLTPVDSNQRVSSTDLHTYAIPVGACLDALAQDEQTQQFRQEAFAPQKHKQRRHKLILSYFSLLLLSCFSLHFTGKIALQKKAGAIVQKHGISFSGEKILYSTPEEFLQKLESSRKEEGLKKASFPYFPTTFSVSEVLFWLSSEQSPGTENGQITIEKFRYVLTQFPKMGKKIEPYVVKIEMEFSAASPRIAKSFYDFLLSDKTRIDTKKEVIWNQNADHYTAAFFLLPKKSPL